VSRARYVARSPKVAARMVGDEMMVMSGKDTTLFALNGTAAVLWNAADGVTPLSEIVEQHICSEFDVAPDVALRDAEALVEELAGDGILLVSDSPIA
jgi:hypothetical protein